MTLDAEPPHLLCENKIRMRIGPVGYAEPSYHFFNESARPESALVRDLLERWFAAYPDVGKSGMRARLLKRELRHSGGAFFELYCYSLLSGQGFSPEVYPHLINGKQTHPDFKVRLGTQLVCYLEMTTARGRDAKMQERLNRI